MISFQKLLLFLLSILLVNTLMAQTVIYTEGFETNGEGSRYTSNTFSFCSGVPGNNPDYFFRTNTNPVLPAGCTIGFTDALTNLQGAFFWASEDIRSSSPVLNANPPGQITTQAISITGFVSLQVSLYLATSSNNNARWETADSINIQASINGGPFVTVGRFMGDLVSGGRLRIDGNLDGAITGADLAITCDQLSFNRYTFAIPGTGTNLRIRLDFDQIGGTEELAIDEIQVTGISTLPVKLVYFNASLLNSNKAAIRWKTEPAADAVYFEIEKSSNGTDFYTLHREMAANTDTYLVTDDNLPGGLCYYRLKMVDSRGFETYSAVVSLTNRPNKVEIQSLFPNPATDRVSIVIASPGNGNGKLTITGMDGKTAWQQPVQFMTGQTVLSVNTGQLSAGVYIIQLSGQNGNPISKAKLVKQ